MPKRRYEDESKAERYARKLRKYEDKLERRRKRQRVLYSSESEGGSEHPVEGNLCLPPEELEMEQSPYPPPDCDIAPMTHTIESAAISITAQEEAEDAIPLSELEPELLKALGEFEPEAEEWGVKVQEDLAKRFQAILLQGLKKETKDDLSKKYLFAQNVPLAKAPTLNPEIAAMLTDSFRNRDKRLFNKQEQLGRSLSTLATAMTILLKKNPDLPEVVRILNDTGKMLADSHFMETESRRALIIPLIDKSLIDPFKNRPRDGMIFGEKLGDLVKDSHGIKRTGQLITASTVSGSLNWKGPPLRGRSQRQSYQYRNGGQRNQYANRRRAPASVPFNPARRQTAAPATPTARRQPPPSRPPPPGRPSNRER